MLTFMLGSRQRGRAGSCAGSSTRKTQRLRASSIWATTATMKILSAYARPAPLCRRTHRVLGASACAHSHTLIIVATPAQMIGAEATRREDRDVFRFEIAVGRSTLVRAALSCCVLATQSRVQTWRDSASMTMLAGRAHPRRGTVKPISFLRTQAKTV